MDKRQAIIDEIPTLRRYALSLSGDPAGADDLVQDCLERALGRLPLWRSGSNMRSWLFTILRNIFFNQVRAMSRRPMETQYDESHEHAQDGEPAQTQGLAVRDIKQALNHLPDSQREVILLIGLENMSYQETADITGVPVGTVMSRLSRGRQTLKTLMDGNSEGGKPSLRRVK